MKEKDQECGRQREKPLHTFNGKSTLRKYKEQERDLKEIMTEKFPAMIKDSKSQDSEDH